MKELFLLTTLVVLPVCVTGTLYYVDGKNGDDSDRGDILDSAFATIKTCIDALKRPGDECHIRAGRYHQNEFQISGKLGTQSQPIVIRGYQGEVPIIDGTVALTPKAGWKLDRKSGIYRCSYGIWSSFRNRTSEVYTYKK